MSCNKPIYVCLPTNCNCTCESDQSDCGCGTVLPGNCDGNQESLDKIIELLTDIKKCVCDCGGGVNPEPGYTGEAIGVILPESGRKSGTALYRVDKDIENVDSVSANYFNEHPLWSGIVREEIDGQAMIKVPAFAYKRGVAATGSNEGKKYLLLAPADTTEPGFERHPAFMKDGQPIEHFWIGAYQACVDPADANKLGSVAETMPVTRITHATARTKASARNSTDISGFMMWSGYQWAAVQMLYLVEYADTDSQTVIGVGNGSGSIKKVNDPVVATSNYRGIIGLWGNVAQLVDGLRVNSGLSVELWNHDGSQSYISTSLAIPALGSTVVRYITSTAIDAGSGYSCNDLFMPGQYSSSVTASQYSDAFWGALANGACSVGCDCFSRGAASGIFTFSFGLAITGSATNVGTRIAKI